MTDNDTERPHPRDASLLTRPAVKHRVVVSLLGVVLVACGQEGARESPTQSTSSESLLAPPEVRQATMVWSSGPGIDLFGTEGVLVRAAREADVVAAYAGIENTYPGFERALSGESRFKYEEGWAPRVPIAGTEYAEIVRIDESPAGFTATVCLDNNQMAVATDGAYVISDGPAYPFLVEFTKLDSDSEMGADGLDPETSRAESDSSGGDHEATWSELNIDVFIGWSVHFPSTTGVVAEACPGTPADRSTIRSETAPVAVAAYPGWPRQ